jgi:hypothetical protein
MSRLKKLALNGVTLLVHFAHGGLLVSGILVAVTAAAYFSGALAPYLPKKDVPAAEGLPPLVVVPPDAAAGTGLQKASVKPLRPEMRTVAGYLARKYRVSTLAIEPLVLAAQEAGSEVGLDPLLILAVTAVESRFNPFAESVMGAQGLMQVIPKFHQDKLEAHGTDHNGLLDPQINIRIGARVLKESIDRMGSLEAGLQQYAGALADADAQYAAKVIAEKARLEQAMRQQATRRTRPVDA